MRAHYLKGKQLVPFFYIFCYYGMGRKVPGSLTAKFKHEMQGAYLTVESPVVITLNNYIVASYVGTFVKVTMLHH